MNLTPRRPARADDSHAKNCPHCKAKQATPQPAAPAVPEQIQLPTEPRPIRVHTPGLRPQDCTLHPDGTLTAVFNGREHRNLMTFADMLETGWKDSRIELDPAPLEDADGDGGALAGTSVQDALPSGTDR